MSSAFKCPKCGFGFAMSTVEYLAIGAECPRCGVKDDKRKKAVSDAHSSR